MQELRSVVPTVLLAAGLLAGCDTPPTSETTGMAIGAVAGGLLGTQIGQGSGRTAAIIAGTLAGGMVGQSVGRNMDNNDRMRTAHALETAPTGTPTAWRNPDTGNQFTVVPTQTIATAQGPCREYTMETMIGGRPEQVFGRACRQADGSWRVQE
jgi:surface antigen